MKARYLTLLLAAATLLPAQAPRPARAPDVPFVPTTDTVVEAMLRMAGVTANDTVYDLGCGDGRIVITAAKTFGAHGVGIDINPVRIEEAKANASKAGVESLVQFREGDLFEAEISPASVVTLYLLPTVNLRLRPKLLSDLKPGTRVVSHAFSMGDWQPEKEETVGGTTIYLWRIPDKK